MTEHFGQDDLTAFFHSLPNRSLYLRVSKHLLEGCCECLSRAKTVLGLLEDPRVLLPSQALAVFFRESALLKDERSKAAVSWARIAALGERERESVMKTRSRFKKYGLAAHVLDEAEALAARGKIEKAKELVRFSQAVTNRLPRKLYGDAPIADLQLRQGALVSHICRLSLDFTGALEALRRVEPLKEEGLDLAEKARFYRVRAAVLFDLGEIEDAARSASEAAQLYRDVADPHSEGRALVQEAMILAQLDPEAGVERAERGLKLLNPADSHPFVSGIYNQALCLINLQKAEEAHELLSAHRRILREITDVGTELSFQALDALILKSRHRIQDADQLFSYLALRFGEEGMHREMLLANLERIRIKVETGRWKSAINIATRLTPELVRLGLRNDLLGMWASLQDALIQKTDILREVETLIRRRWYAPFVR
jgi:tetratricopeptide (TPR) repeat protein